MLCTSRSCWLPVVIVIGLVWGGWMVSTSDDRRADEAAPAAQAQPRERSDAAIQLAEFMRRKLDASSQILEGLCTDDMTLVREGATVMQEMSVAEKWRVSTDPMYRQFSNEFQEIMQQLIAAAEEGNSDRVALKWMSATICCLDCHRFTRSMLVVGGNR